MSRTKYLNPVSGDYIVDPASDNLEEGMFYERIFTPVEVKVCETEINDKPEQYMILINAEMQELFLWNKHPQTHIMHFFWLDRGQNMGEYSDAAAAVRTEMLNGQIQAWKERKGEYKSLKFFYDPDDDYVSVASLKHKQISWGQVKATVDAAVVQVYGATASIQDPDRLNVWAYQLPVDNKYVSIWAEVEGGNNKKQGRSAIRINTKVRTEFDRPSGGLAAPCLNWAHLWDVALNSLGLNVQRIDQAIGQRLETVDGEVPAVPIMVNTFDIHLQSTEILQELIAEPLRQLKEFAESVVMKEFIELSITELIKADEAVDMLDAYSDIHKLPAYIRNAIVAKFTADEDMTVWGFSQAVSYVRTHGELKGKSSRNTKSVTFILERIAGEVLSLAPTIQELHRQHGDITYEKLIGHPRATACPICEKQRRWHQTHLIGATGPVWQLYCPTEDCEGTENHTNQKVQIAAPEVA